MPYYSLEIFECGWVLTCEETMNGNVLANVVE